MRIEHLILLGALLPLYAAAADGPITITSLSEGFVISETADTIPIGGTIAKGLWEGPIAKLGGQLVVSASTAGKDTSQAVEYAFPSLHPAGKYGFGVVLDANALRDETEIPLTVRVVAKNYRGMTIAYAEIHGTLQQRAPAPLTITLASFTPPSAVYERASTWNSFSAITFAAGYEDAQIQMLALTRDGGADNDLVNVRLFDGSTQVGFASRFSNGKAAILLAVPVVIPSGSSKTIVIKADVDAGANTYSIENGIAIGIASASDVRTLGMETGNLLEPAGFAPVFGNPMGIR